MKKMLIVAVFMGITGSGVHAQQRPTGQKFEKFTAQNAALLLLDEQLGLLARVNSNPQGAIKHNVLMLASLAKVTGMPAFITTSREGEFGAPFPELEKIQREAYATRSKRSGIYDIFDDPVAVKWIKATGRKKLIIAGLTSDVCGMLASTHAVGEGYEVRYVVDASGSMTLFQDQAALMRINQSGATLTSTLGIIIEMGDLIQKSMEMLDSLLEAPSAFGTLGFLEGLIRDVRLDASDRRWAPDRFS